MSKCHISIRELLLNYKGALQSLIPWLEKANIPYKEGEAYDEWDAITSTLYEIMVISPISYSKDLINNNPFPKYDFQYQNYKDLNFIMCEETIGKDEFLVFISFSVGEDFEMINVCSVVKDSLEVTSIKKIELNKVNFYINYQTPLDNITLEV